jgi:hypothetical protein
MHFLYASLDTQRAPPTELPPEDKESDRRTSVGTEPAEVLIVTKSEIDDNLFLKTTQEIPEKTNKQGKSSREKGAKTNLEKKDIVPATTDINRVLKEKQLHFLRYWKNNTETNRPTNVLGSSTSTDQLAAIDSEKIHVLEDGNCFFRAISHQLYGRQKDYPIIRSKAAEYLNSNKKDFAPFINTNRDGTIEQYIERMRDDKTYADHLAILATAISIDKNIIVHRIGEKKPRRIPGSNCFDNQLHVWYDRSMKHYDSVLRVDGARLILPSEQILDT